MSADGTIFAVGSGAGRAAVAVLRISGDRSGAVLTQIAGRLPAPRHASLRLLRAGEDVLDRAVVLWFPKPASYTGEDCVELHLHGGAAVVAGVADALVALGLRPAEPGEFTRRAFLNGRMDLTEAEAVADLVAAETASQRRQALRQLDGALGRLYGDWANRLLRLMAQQEALIDFPEEEISDDFSTSGMAEIEALMAEMRRHLHDDRKGERLRAGVTVAVAGPPNVGKSSLFNVLCGRDAAIVSARPGTTRDAIETRVIWGGVPVTLVDTAGLRETADDIEAEGVRRARERASEADLVIDVHVAGSAGTSEEERTGAVVRVANKIDLQPSATQGIPVSARTGEGIARLREILEREVRRLAEPSGGAPLTRARHRAALMDALQFLEAAAAASLPELRGEDLRLALRAIGRITGRVDTEDVLDVIFREFCIGK
jgi:tRNA modification GTPase